MEKRSVPMSFARLRMLAADQGDRVAKLEEIIEIATAMLAAHKKPARKSTKGTDRMERGGRDREE